MNNIPLIDPTTADEIYNYLFKLKSNTAPGNDRINSELLKYGLPSIHQEIIDYSRRIEKQPNTPRID